MMLRSALLLAPLWLLGCTIGQVAEEPVEDAPAAPPSEARASFAAVTQLMKGGQWAAAETQLLQLRTRYPHYSGVVLNLGIVFARTDRATQAEEAFRAALAINPQNSEAANHLAALLRQKGRFSEARDQYLAVLAMVPDDASTHLNLGILYDLYLQEPAAARRHYEAYQQAQVEPERRVSGWILDLERRMDQPVEEDYP